MVPVTCTWCMLPLGSVSVTVVHVTDGLNMKRLLGDPFRVRLCSKNRIWQQALYASWRTRYISIVRASRVPCLLGRPCTYKIDLFCKFIYFLPHQIAYASKSRCRLAQSHSMLENLANSSICRTKTNPPQRATTCSAAQPRWPNREKKLLHSQAKEDLAWNGGPFNNPSKVTRFFHTWTSEARS